MSDAIIVRGVRAEGRHGLRDLGERDNPQPFVVDVELRGDWSAAAESDSIDDALDYREVVRTVREVVEGESFELVETLADAIARALLELSPDSVRVRVSKPKVAALMGIDEVAVVVEREG